MEILDYHLAIDIGASGGRHILGYVVNGKLLSEEVYRFTNNADETLCGLVWNTERLFKEILAGIKKCKELGKIPKTIGIDTWGVDYVLLDRNGKEILPVFSYRNSRTDKIASSVPFEKMYSKTGIAFNKFNTVYQLLADKAAGRLDNAADFLMLPEYFSYLLTELAAHEYTNVSTTGLVNAKTGDWDYDLIEGLGFSKKLFTEIEKAGYVLGGFRDNIKAELGFDCTVILPATHDTASAVVAASEGVPYISSGTWSLLGIVCEPVLTDKARECNYTNEGAAFGNVRFLKNIMGLWIIQEVRRELCNEYSFAELAQAAEKEAVCDWSIDINKQAFFAPKSMIETIKSECAANGQPVPKTTGELAHCIFNSLSHSYKKAVEELESITGKKYTAINIIGGGSNNQYLNKLTAKITGKKVIAGPSEATAMGNLLVQIAAYNNADKNYIEKIKINSVKTEVFDGV